MCNLLPKMSHHKFHADDLHGWIHHSSFNFHAVVPFINDVYSLLLTRNNNSERRGQ